MTVGLFFLALLLILLTAACLVSIAIQLEPKDSGFQLLCGCILLFSLILICLVAGNSYDCQVSDRVKLKQLLHAHGIIRPVCDYATLEYKLISPTPAEEKDPNASMALRLD